MKNGLNNIVLQVNHVSKSFPGVKALNDVNFTLYTGEVHVIVGENGAGKSTLIKCIQGIYNPDQGSILYRGKEITKDIRKRQVACVHQELSLIPYLDAAQNIFFGQEPVYGKTGWIDEKTIYDEAKSMLKKLHCDHINMHAPVKELSHANQQMIEIAKALKSKPEIIIFDEPTTSLTNQEVNLLFEQIRCLKNEGISIIFISHRMKEILEIGDRITILRDGQLIHSKEIQGMSEDEIIQAMIGRRLEIHHPEEYDSRSKSIALEVRNFKDKKGKLHSCSLHLYHGEIVGLAGLVGSGRTELVRLIYGMDSLESGELLLKGKICKYIAPDRMAKQGIGFLPEDRKNDGLAIQAAIHWNVLASSLKRYFPSGLLWKKKSMHISDSFIDQMKIATTDSNKRVEELSGGNQQKIVIAKWLAANSDILIFDEPTKGIDIGAKREIYQMMQSLVNEGKTILLISSDLEELMRICHRIYGMREGRITGELCRKDFSQESIGKLILQDSVSDTHNTEKRKKRNLFNLKERSLPPGFYMSLILIVFFTLNANNFLTASNISSILSQSAVLLVLTCGQSLVLLMQGTDLSLGGMVSFLGVLWFYMLNHHISLVLSIAIVLFTGVLCGLFNGFIVAKGRIPVFIVTLGTQNIFRSMALLLSGSQTLYYSSSFFRCVAKKGMMGFTYLSWIAFFSFIFTILLVNHHRFGMRIRGMGGNPQGMILSGQNLATCQIKVFAFAGFMAAISSILLCCRIESGNPVAANGMEFNAIAAALLGGISMREGKGKIQGILFGVLLIQMLKSGLTQIGLNAIYQNAAMGLVVLTAIIVDQLLERNRENSPGRKYENL